MRSAAERLRNLEDLNQRIESEGPEHLNLGLEVDQQSLHQIQLIGLADMCFSFFSDQFGVVEKGSIHAMECLGCCLL